MNPNEDKKSILVFQNKVLTFLSSRIKTIGRSQIETQEKTKNREREGVKNLSTSQFSKWKCILLFTKKVFALSKTKDKQKCIDAKILAFATKLHSIISFFLFVQLIYGARYLKKTQGYHFQNQAIFIRVIIYF